MKVRKVKVTIFCPFCQGQHIDEGKYAIKPHYTIVLAFILFIFSCSKIHPWMRVSGLGGHPGT